MKKILTILALIIPAHIAFAASTVVNNTISLNETVNIEDQIKIESAWIRVPSPSSVNTAAYFTLENNTGEDIILSEVKSIENISNRVEIHGYKPDDQGVKKMFKLESVTIPNASSVEFKPGSFHVMIMGLNKDFKIKAGEAVRLTLKLRPANHDSNLIIPDKIVEFIAK